MSDEQGGEMTGEAGGPGEDALRQELAQNVVESEDLPPGYQLEGPAEPGADADVPGILGGPGITIISEDQARRRWPRCEPGSTTRSPRPLPEARRIGERPRLPEPARSRPAALNLGALGRA